VREVGHDQVEVTPDDRQPHVAKVELRCLAMAELGQQQHARGDGILFDVDAAQRSRAQLAQRRQDDAAARPDFEHLGALHHGGLRLQHLDQRRGILAWSQGRERQLGRGVRDQSRLRHVNYPQNRTSQAQSPPMPFAIDGNLS
jgi:hypothetical protein